MRKLKAGMKIFGRAKRKDNKMKWVWYHIYKNTETNNIFVDKTTKSWYTNIWLKIKDYLSL
jgi:hypothetical protein